MKHVIRTLVLAIALVAGLMSVSAQTVQVLVIQKVPNLPPAATNYLDDPFRYFNVQFIMTGAGSEGLDIFLDMDFSLNDGSFYLRTKPNSKPYKALHLSEGVNIMKKDELQIQLRDRRETNLDLSSPLQALQLPEGTYELCMDIYRWGDWERTDNLSVGACPTYEICYSASAPELLSPLAGAQMALNGAMVVPPMRKVKFFWTPVISNCADGNFRYKYQLKVVKVLNGQNYNDAIKINPTVFSTEVRNKNYAEFDTLRDVKVVLERGALYVAQVQAEQIKDSRPTVTLNVSNDCKSQPMPFYWAYCPEENVELYYTEDDDEEEDDGEAVAGLTVWTGGVEEVSELDEIYSEAIPDESVVLHPKRHYVMSDGYYTIPMTKDIEVGYRPVLHKSIKDASYALELYDYRSGGIDSITAYEPLFRENIEKVPESSELINRTLAGWGEGLEQGSLYYLQLLNSFTVGYWDYSIADTNYYVNDMLAEHIHDTISRNFTEEEYEYGDGVFFQWGDDPEAPAFKASQWKAPVDRSGDDVYDLANYKLPTSVPEVRKDRAFPVSWTPVKGVAQGDEVEYEINVYELKSGQTVEEAVSENEALVSRTVTNANAISNNDTQFFKVFSSKKTYVMTLSVEVTSESNDYHFENGNEAIPIVFKVVK